MASGKELETSFFVGLDLGQRQDYTALSVIERHGQEIANPTTAQKEEPGARYHVRHLKRYELGTPYPAIVADVAAICKKEPLNKSRTVLVLDATGVGAPVVDMFKREELPCELIALTITGGSEVTHQGQNYNVPKRDLVSTTQVLLQSGRLKIAKELPEAATLVKEFENFQVKITLAANDTYGAWREGMHDDLVLAVAMACWKARQPSGKFVCLELTWCFAPLFFAHMLHLFYSNVAI